MIILASQSPIRSQLLQQAGLSHMVKTSHVNETEIQSAIPPHASDHLAAILSKAKAAAVAKIFPHDFVIGADQTLEFDGQILHKSQDVAAARQTLLDLRGKPHVLHAAVTVMKADQVLFEFTGQATLTMRHFSLNYLAQYLTVEGDNVLTSVGCYKLEGPGIQLFETIEGDYFTILGLPLLPLLAFFREIGELPS